MCGIAGKIYFKQKVIDKNREVPLIGKTLEKLRHRGPDDKGYIIEENVWLAGARLAIIDLSPTGHQPIKNEDESIFLVFNGEIYNYKELKSRLNRKHRFISQTDSEVLIHLYEEKGVNCLSYLRGMFAFAIWDKKKKQLFLARDRIGQKPLKYYFSNKFFIFASELKAFIDYPDIVKEIDWQAIDEFLTYQYVPSPKTGFKNIWKLPAAHYIIVKSNGEIIKRRYWRLDFSKRLDLSEKKWQEVILDKLKESVELRLQSDVPLGVHLSGGIDSGMITAIASSQSKKPIKTFSIGFKESFYNELSFARLIAKQYHTDHHEFVVKSDVIKLLDELVYQYEEPFADPSILPTWYLAKESRKHFTVALNGDGGDENFAGYRRYQVMQFFNFLKFIPFRHGLGSLLTNFYKIFKKKDIYHFARVLSLPYSTRESFYQDLVSFINSIQRDQIYTNEFKEKVADSRSKEFIKEKLNKYSNLDKIDQLLSVDINSYLPDCLLTKTDIASMGHSLEVRSPFLDHIFMELVAQMPSNFKLKQLNSKYIFKKIARNWLPRECIYRKKRAFVPPFDIWFRKDLFEYLKSQLLNKKFLALNLFQENKLKQLIEAHYHYRMDSSYLLWSLLYLREWFWVWFKI